MGKEVEISNLENNVDWQQQEQQTLATLGKMALKGNEFDSFDQAGLEKMNENVKIGFQARLGSKSARYSYCSLQ